MNQREHWEGVYQTKEPTAVSWFRPHLDRSLALIASCALPPDAHLVDVGGGASTLVDDLLAQGHHRLTVVDLAAPALARSRERLGERAAGVTWIVGDATETLLEPVSVDLWHDRAVFHFLTTQDQRAAYAAQVSRVVRPGGYALLATFALDGPERCSGLPVQRHDAASLAAALGPGFTPVTCTSEVHQTPWGSHQPFVYALLRRTPEPPIASPP